MLTLERLKENQIQPYFTNSQWARGVAMQAQVYSPTRYGNRLYAQVEGDQMYEVEVAVDEQGITGRCGCGYDRPELCKHVCAVLVRWTRVPGTFKVSNAPVKVTSAPAGPLAVRPAPAPALPAQPPAWLARSADMVVGEEFAELQAGLEMMTVATLREIASSRGWTLRGTLKASIVEQMAAYMVDDQALATGLSMVEKNDQVLLGLIAAVGDLFPYNTSKPIVDITTEFRKPVTARAVMRAFDRLGQIPLILTGQLLGQGAFTDAAVMPRALWRHLPALLASLMPGATELPPSARRANVRESQPRRFVDAALQLLLAIEHLPPTRAPRTPRPVIEDHLPWLRDWEYDVAELESLLAEGRPLQNRDIRLTVPPPPRGLVAEDLARFQGLLGSLPGADFLFRLLEGAGLFLPGTPVRVNEQAKRAFLQCPPAEQLGILFDAYVDLLDWQEIWELIHAASPQLKMVRKVGGYQFVLPGATSTAAGQMTKLRQAMLQVLAWLPEERWISVEELCKLFYCIAPTFNQLWAVSGTGGYPYQPGWYFTWEGRVLGHEPEDWGRLVGNCLGFLLVGPLNWFGVADVHVDGSALSHVRLHGLAHLFRHASPPIELDRAVAAAGPAVLVTAPPVVTGDTIKLKSLAGNAALVLEQIAQPETLQLNNVVYRLDVARVHAAFERGASVDSLAEEWERCFGARLPAEIQKRLAAWWQQYGQVRLYQNLTLIEFADDYALAEMRAVTAIDDLLLVEISPRAVVIPATAVESLYAALQKAGYTPKLTDGTE